MLSAAGEFNPMTFKQNYDQMIATYSPLIERKLEYHQQKNNWNDRQMQQWLGTQPELQSFILDYANLESPLRELAKPYIPAGFVPGVGLELQSEPFRYGMSLYGGRALGGAISGAMGAKGGFGAKLKGAGAGAWKNAKLFDSVVGGKGVMGKALGGQIPTSALIKNKYQKQIAANKNTLSSQTAAEKRLLKNKKWTPAKKGQFKGLSKSQVADKIAKTKASGTALDLKAKKGATVSAKTIEKYKNIHGKNAMIKLASKKLGSKKVATKLVSKALASLVAAPLTGGLSLAMNAWTLYDLASLITGGLKETPTKTGPGKMLFGGGVPTEVPDDYLSDEHQTALRALQLKMGIME